MATGWPMKTTYANGDVYSSSDVNDITGTINLLGSSVAYTAGKNKILNSDFRINQRGFTSATANQTYTFDRWVLACSAGVITLTPQTFTAGTAPVAGYEGTNFIRSVTTVVSTSNDVALLQQRIEDVRTFAGQTMTLSFWAKAASGTPKIQPTIEQNFGTGGSATVITIGTAVTLSTSWARYTATFSIPSISGKTIGTSSSLYIDLGLTIGTAQTAYGTIGTQAATIDIWGVQAENGSTATIFQTATGTIQGELAACQRYYYRQTASQVYSSFSTWASAYTTSIVDNWLIPFPVSMRVAQTSGGSLTVSNIMITDGSTNYSTGTFSLATTAQSVWGAAVRYQHGTAALTQYRTYQIVANNNAAAYIEYSAEL